LAIGSCQPLLNAGRVTLSGCPLTSVRGGGATEVWRHPERRGVADCDCSDV